MDVPKPEYVTSEARAKYWRDHYLESAMREGGLGLDTETTGLVRRKDRVVVWSLADSETRVCIEASLIPIFKEPLLENPLVNFDLTNAAFDAHMLANSGADIVKAGEWRCTIVQDWLKNENRQGSHGLKECTRDYLGRTPPEFKDVFLQAPRKVKDKATGIVTELTMGIIIRNHINDPKTQFNAIDYASLDAYNTNRLRVRLDELLDEIIIYDDPAYGRRSLKNHFYAIEVPTSKILYKMERAGIRIDHLYLSQLRDPMGTRLADIEEKFNREVGEEINLNSTVALHKLFFEILGRQPIKFTKGGKSGVKKPSIDEEALKRWDEEFGDPWAALLLEYRGISKTKSTYVDGLLNWIDPELNNYRIRTSIKHGSVVTGRLATTEPNLLAIPRPQNDEFKIRQAFTADAARGKTLIVADYAQLEMRLMAHFSQDPTMIDAILNGVDLHCLSVSKMYNIKYEDVIAAVKAEKAEKKAKEKGLPFTPLTALQEQYLVYRQGAKAIGFGIIYGIGGGRLAIGLNKDAKPDENGNIRELTPDDGNDLIRMWLSVFPGVEYFINQTKKYVASEGEVQTILGRRRRFGNLAALSRGDKARAERQAVNSIIQGTAADVAKCAMIRVDEDEELNRLGNSLLLQIHDELINESDLATVELAKARVKHCMENPFGDGIALRVPLTVEVGHGPHWAAAK